jgi:hypothetical protein
MRLNFIIKYIYQIIFLTFAKQEIKRQRLKMHFTGIIIALLTFFIIGIFHPIVIKAEYHWGTNPWIIFLIFGIICIGASLLAGNVILSSLLGILGATLLWSIGELFSQKKRVEKGWFPMNPKRKDKYRPICKSETGCSAEHKNSENKK